MSPQPHAKDLFIAEYTLGLLETDQLAQAHSLLGSDDAAVTCSLQWEERLLGLTDALTPLHASNQLLNRIQKTLSLPLDAAASTPIRSSASAPKPANVRSISTPPAAPLSVTQSGATHDFQPRLIKPDSASAAAADSANTAKQELNADATGNKPGRPEAIGNPDAAQSDAVLANTAPTDFAASFEPKPDRPPMSRPSAWRSLWLWRALSAALAILVVVLALPENTFKGEPASNAQLQPPTLPAPEIIQVAIMQAPGSSSTPGWVLTIDTRQNIVLRPQVEIVVPEAESMYLWTYNEHAPQPRLLGLVDPQRSLSIPVEVAGELSPGQIFEMTQEPNSAPPYQPEGPILFIGRTVSLG